MKYGVSMFPTHDAIDPGSLAQLAEAAGFESLFFPDHSHIPARRLTPFPGGLYQSPNRWQALNKNRWSSGFL